MRAFIILTIPYTYSLPLSPSVAHHNARILISADAIYRKSLPSYSFIPAKVCASTGGVSSFELFFHLTNFTI